MWRFGTLRGFIFNFNNINRPSYRLLIRYLCSQDEKSITLLSKSRANETTSHSDEKNNEEKVVNTDSNMKKKQTNRKKFLDMPISDSVEQSAGKAAVKAKLLSLLSEIKVIENFSEKNSHYNLKLAKPQQRIGQKKQESQLQDLTREKKVSEESIIGAAENLTLNSEEKKELYAALQKGVYATSPRHTQKQDNLVTEELGENLMSAVKAVASTEFEDTEARQSALTKKLLSLRHSKENSESPVEKKDNLISLFKGIKVHSNILKAEEQSDSISLSTTSKKIQNIISRTHIKRKVDIMNSQPLGIFSFETSESHDLTKKTKLLLWCKLKENTHQFMVHLPPTNAFEELIQWTEQGKHWKFPIDNEIDVGDEENVGFHEHVFLEHHLRDCTEKGPIRHFMELVITGLSKNPYITVDRKIENIEWFKQYFKDKEDVLKKTGV